MKLTHSSAKLGLLVLLGAPLIVFGCNSDPATGGAPMYKMIAQSAGPMTIYPDPYAGTAMAGTANPIPATVSGTAMAWDVGGKMKLDLILTGLPAGRAFGAHLHKLSCTDAMKAGGHYQNMMWPPDSGPNDPVYANKDNEAWLDFMADATGKGQATTTVDWLPRAGGAQAIIVHHMTTAPGGVAGAKLACLPIAF
jgi:hypothetical protein